MFLSVGMSHDIFLPEGKGLYRKPYPVESTAAEGNVATILSPKDSGV